MSVSCECCLLWGRGLCDDLITRPEESYRVLCVVVCDLETSWMRLFCPQSRPPQKRKIIERIRPIYQSRWPRGLRFGSTASRLLGMWGPSPDGSMDNCDLCVLCFVRQKSLRRTDQSSRGVLPTVVFRTECDGKSSKKSRLFCHAVLFHTVYMHCLNRTLTLSMYSEVSFLGWCL